MKRIIALTLITGVLASIMPKAGQAQVERQVIAGNHTCTNVDTVTTPINSIGSHLKSVTVVVTKLGGTATGTVIIEGTDDGTEWFPAGDTLVLANQTTNKKVWLFTATYYNSYRTKYISSGTQSSVIRTAFLRRKDE